MRRDGTATSLWQTIPEYQPKTGKAPDEIFDVIIIGGGITGVSAA